MRRINTKGMSTALLPVVLFIVLFLTMIFIISHILGLLDGTKAKRMALEIQQEWFSAYHDSVMIHSDLVVPPIPYPDSTEVLDGRSN